MDEFKTLARRASARYEIASVTAKHFAYGKMTGDPVYAQVLRDGLMPPSGAVLDIGCGQGLMLALLVEAGRDGRLIGIETRPRMAYLARVALGAKADVLEADARQVEFDRSSTAILFDVLQMMPPPEQEALLTRIVASLEPGGVILVREADASAGWRYQMVRVSNHLKARVIGSGEWSRYYRPREQWLECFDRVGLITEVCATPSRNPLGNVLFRARRK